MLGGYITLRCLLLGTMENSEPRYSLECYPIFIVAAAAVLGGSKMIPGAGKAPPNDPANRPSVRQSTSD